MNAVQPPFQLAEAPGSRAAFHLGLWSLLLNLCCGCFPVAVPLGIAAIAKYNRAKREAACAPDQYAQPPATGMVLGIVGLCCTFFALMWIGIYSAIAIPALLGQRARARDKAAEAQMNTRLVELVGAFEQERTPGRSPAEVEAALEARVRSWNGQDRNPWEPQGTAYAPDILILPGGLATGDVESMARSIPSRRGEVTFLVQFPAGGMDGHAAGAVKLQGGAQGNVAAVRVVPVP